MATLAELTEIVKKELGVYDAVSVSLIETYLSKNYVTIWDRYPWSDTEIRIVITLPSSVSTLVTPATINRVVTIRARNIFSGDIDTPAFRADARMLEPVTSKFLIETQPEIFEQGGYVKYYEETIEQGQKKLRFYPISVESVELFIVGKAPCPGLVAQTDSSFIRNIDPALLAYATADMLQRQRQYGKAEIKYKRGQELEAVAWNLEQQQANQPRMTKATTVAGNTLAEMTDAVCVICGQWTPDYRLVIREFLRRNYQVLYDTLLLPESLVVVRMSYTTEQVILPEYIDEVIGVRGNNDLRMFPAEAGLLLDITPEVFDQLGDEVSYTTLTPVGVSSLPAAATRLVFTSTSPVDTSPVMIRGEVLSTGQQLEETLNLKGTAPVASDFIYDVPITIAKDITVGYVNVNSESPDNKLLVQLLPYQRESKHQRLWFLPEPQLNGGTPLHVLVLGKRAIRPLLAEQDTPIITGAQHVLIAAAAGDLFRKLEKHDMANAMLQKAAGATEVLKARKRDQAASSPRFVPQVEPRAYIASLTSW